MTQEALKLAFEALNDMACWQEGREVDMGFDEPYAADTSRKAITAIKEALAEHAMRETQRLGQEIEQEPIGFVQQSVLDWLYSKHRSSNAHTTTTIAKSPTETEDVAIYTTPLQRTWVGLTDDERIEIHHQAWSRIQVVQMTEAKLKEKNT